MTYHDTVARYRECLDPLRDGKGFDLIHPLEQSTSTCTKLTHGRGIKKD